MKEELSQRQEVCIITKSCPWAQLPFLGSAGWSHVVLRDRLVLSNGGAQFQGWPMRLCCSCRPRWPQARTRGFNMVAKTTAVYFHPWWDEMLGGHPSKGWFRCLQSHTGIWPQVKEVSKRNWRHQEEPKPFSKTSADPHPVPGSRLGLGGSGAAGDSHLLWLSSLPGSLLPCWRIGNYYP